MTISQGKCRGHRSAASVTEDRAKGSDPIWRDWKVSLPGGLNRIRRKDRR